jgi:hypothetical protein
MAVTYLSGGESPSASAWNSGVFSELERKIGLALDGKSPLIPDSGSGSLLQIFPALVGNRFLFTNGTRVYSAHLGGSNYSHQQYVDSAAAAVHVSFDDDLLIETVSGLSPSLDASLQAHTRNSYFLKENNVFAFPEKRYKYAVAELIYEGIGYETVTFPRTYDKYNFFRIHNLNPYPMSFRFEVAGGYETFNVPAMGCRAVRRTSVDSGYLGDWNYLWKARSGDPRFFKCLLPENGGIIATALANNVVHPACVYEWAFVFSTLNGLGGAKWHFDPHVYNDVSDIYCPDYFPDPDDTTQPIGNFFHHKGIVEIGSTRYTFNGYQSITTDLPTLGITTLANDVLTVRPSGAATCYTSNLFNQYNQTRPTLAANVSVNLDNTNSSTDNLVMLKSEAVQLGFGDIVISRDTMLGVSNAPSNFSFHKDTLAEVLTLEHFGNAAYVATQQNTNATTITDRSLKITPFGPRILFTEAIDFGGSWWGSDEVTGVNSPLDDIYATFSGATLTRKGFVQFEGYGFPVRELQDIAIGSYYKNPAFLSPRKPRAYSRANQGHPNILNLQENTNGADFDLRGIAYDYEVTPFAMMAWLKVAAREDDLDFTVREWENPDSLWGGMPRVPLLREHYNAMAMLLNQVRRISPLFGARHASGLDYMNVKAYLPTLDTVATIPAPNFTGVLNGYCPLEMYCSFTKDGEEQKFFERIGVTIRTEADLPQDYHDARANIVNAREQVVEVTDTVTAAAHPNYTYRHEVTGVYTRATGEQAASISEVTDFRWVKIADVKSAVEALGWNFLFADTYSTHSIATQDLTPSMVYSLPGAVTANFTSTGPVYSVGYQNKFFGAFTYVDKTTHFIDDDEGEWKKRTTTPTVTETTASGVLQASQIGDPSGSTLFGGQVAIFVFQGQDEQVLIASGYRNTDLAGYTRYVMAQLYATSGLENASRVISIPVTWAAHVSEGVSVPTYAQAIAGQTGGANAPLEEVAKINSSTSLALTSGDTIYTFREGESIEIVPVVQVYLEAEA